MPPLLAGTYAQPGHGARRGRLAGGLFQAGFRDRCFLQLAAGTGLLRQLPGALGAGQRPQRGREAGAVRAGQLLAAGPGPGLCGIFEGGGRQTGPADLLRAGGADGQIHRPEGRVPGAFAGHGDPPPARDYPPVAGVPQRGKQGGGPRAAGTHQDAGAGKAMPGVRGRLQILRPRRELRRGEPEAVPYPYREGPYSGGAAALLSGL